MRFIGETTAWSGSGAYWRENTMQATQAREKRLMVDRKAGSGVMQPLSGPLNAECGMRSGEGKVGAGGLNPVGIGTKTLTGHL